MARIEYDEDDHDDDRPARDWRRTLLTWMLALAGLGLGFLGAQSPDSHHASFGRISQP